MGPVVVRVLGTAVSALAMLYVVGTEEPAPTGRPDRYPQVSIDLYISDLLNLNIMCLNQGLTPQGLTPQHSHSPALKRRSVYQKVVIVLDI